MRTLVIAALLIGCHHHRDTNAPGVVELERPPSPPNRTTLQYPGDPGERMFSISAGGLGGGGVRTSPGDGMFDLAAEVTLSWGESDRSHNDRASRLFIPRGMLIPQRSESLTLGWSAAQIIFGDSGQPTELELGPLYLEAQRARGWWGVAAGWAFDPTNRDHGPQLNGFVGVNYLRLRYLIDGGFEFALGYQLKIPTTWVWSR